MRDALRRAGRSVGFTLLVWGSQAKLLAVFTEGPGMGLVVWATMTLLSLGLVTWASLREEDVLVDTARIMVWRWLSSVALLSVVALALGWWRR